MWPGSGEAGLNCGAGGRALAGLHLLYHQKSFLSGYALLPLLCHKTLTSKYRKDNQSTQPSFEKVKDTPVCDLSVLSPDLSCLYPGGHVAEPRQGNDDCHQWSSGLWQAATKARDPVVPECQTGIAFGSQSTQRHGNGVPI